MKFCKNCGTQLEEGAVQCQNCGTMNENVNQTTNDQNVENQSVQPETPIQEQQFQPETPVQPQQFQPETPVQPQQFQPETPVQGQQFQPETPVQPQQFQPETPVQPQQFQQQQGPKKKSKLKIIIPSIIVAVLAVVAVLVVVLINANKNPKFKAADYITVEFTGVDGYGEADVDLDTEKLQKLILKKYGLSEKNLNMSKAAKAYSAYQALSGAIKYKVNKDEDLKNGDKVKVTITADSKVFDKYGYDLDKTAKTVTVKGLKKVKEIDVFKDIDVEITGTAPSDIDVNIENNSKDDFIKDIYFSCSDYDGKKPGDKVTVVASVDEDYALNKGYKIKSKEKEYKIPELDTYEFTSKDVTDKNIADIKADVEEAINDYVSRDSSIYTMADLKYEGYYLGMYKEDDSWHWGDNNYMYVVYSATLNSVDGKFQPTTVYFPVYVRDIILDVDGNLSSDYDVDKYSLNGDANIKGTDGYSVAYISGYLDIPTMYEKYVTKADSDYTVECVGNVK